MKSAKGLLQIGYDCGLTLPEEAYSMIQCHYDVFFRIEHILHDKLELIWSLKQAGILTFYMGVGTWAEGTIVEHAARLGITLEELDFPTEESADDICPVFD